jgi:hypothetical protein
LELLQSNTTLDFAQLHLMWVQLVQLAAKSDNGWAFSLRGGNDGICAV